MTWTPAQNAVEQEDLQGPGDSRADSPPLRSTASRTSGKTARVQPSVTSLPDQRDALAVPGLVTRSSFVEVTDPCLQLP